MHDDFTVPDYCQQIMFQRHPECFDDASFRNVFRSLRSAKIRILGLSGTQITDASIPKLQQLEHLEALCLYGTQVTPGGLAQLRSLKKLRSLGVGGDAFDSAAMAQLHAELPGVDLPGWKPHVSR